MVDILHRIGVEHGTTDSVYEALTTIDGLAGWWTTDTTGDPGPDGVIAFRFVPGGFDMAVRELVPGKLVRWEVLEGPAEWLGTEITFELRQDGHYTIVLFAHRGWTEVGEFMYHCSTKWASFLLSLKELVETGTGRPAPADLQISDWH
ncbi:MAG: SRPBCC domain-containing protein [Microbacterium sp.]|nr:MAG: SRPBCC domain-containing protein [Microbacterium sp.]